MKKKNKKKEKIVKNSTNYKILGSQELSIIMIFLARSFSKLSIMNNANINKIKDKLFALCISKDNLIDMKFLLAEIYIIRRYHLFIPFNYLLNDKLYNNKISWDLLWEISSYNYFVHNNKKKISVYFHNSKNSALIEGFIIYHYNKNYTSMFGEPLIAIFEYKELYKNEKIKFYPVDILDNLDSISENSFIMPIFKQINKSSS